MVMFLDEEQVARLLSWDALIPAMERRWPNSRRAASCSRSARC
jgi:hypothetical protein